METRSMRYSKEEAAQRGDEIYIRDVLPKEESQNDGKIVAIDIDTGDYEIGEDELEAAHGLFARHPDAQIWFARIGSRASHRIGGGRWSPLS